MARYIDADKLKDNFCEACSTHKRYCMTVEKCRAREQPDYKWCFKMRLIDNAPTADVVEVKHGEWKGKPIAGYSDIKCSVCSKVFPHQTGKWNFCPNCGAKMDGGVNDDSL